MIEMVEAQSEYNGDVFHRNGVTVINQEARDYVMQNNETKFDLVSLTLMESLPVFSLANSRIHSYIFTTEALRDYASVLSHDGYISVVETSWPHMVKILGMLNEAWNQGLLSDGAVANDDSFFKHIFVCEIKEIPGEEYVPFRYLVLFRKSSIDPKTESLLSSRTLTNNHTILLAPSGPRKLLHKETTELLNLAVATDDFPYFYHIQSMRKENGGFLILLVSLLFLMLIIYIRSSGAQEKNMATSLRSAFYFSLTGSAFMMIESGLLYHACFVLSIPTLATAITLLGILTGAASSSWISAQMDLSNRMIRTWMFLLISCLVIASISLPIFKEITTFRSLAILVVMYGLGVLLGVAFPLGLRHFRDPKSSSVGWYYGFSALGTVVGVVLFLLVSEEWGIRAALILGTGLYLCSFIFMGRVTSPLRSSQ
ncbi:MAG: hypothetical protein JKX97_02780 [Candidatus Lindowbacteria bacterium]|nr:hypothetical protein [Candidatus Lindowbacteria bacterium]